MLALCKVVQQPVQRQVRRLGASRVLWVDNSTVAQLVQP